MGYYAPENTEKLQNTPKPILCKDNQTVSENNTDDIVTTPIHISNVTRLLSPGNPAIANIRQKLESFGYIFTAYIMVSLHSNFCGRLRKRMYFETECIMAIQVVQGR